MLSLVREGWQIVTLRARPVRWVRTTLFWILIGPTLLPVFGALILCALLDRVNSSYITPINRKPHEQIKRR